MLGIDRKPDVSVDIGDGVAVIRRKGVSRPIVASILGSEFDGEGQPTRVVLDRVVHKPHEQSFLGWHVCGAFVSVLERSTE